MIDRISFQTAARTVDHLGREQIADTPTAVSELWKNAYDAYARNVQLNIHDGPVPVATILDDGHGMDRDDFISRWLVVGTSSKAAADTTSIEDRNGLPSRARQGQKGIGRLSCANLGPLLLFVSKRAHGRFVAALVDWRLFENPYLTLSDIRLPVVEFDDRAELFDRLTELAAQLLQNVDGSEDPDHSERVRSAWSMFDALHGEEVRLNAATRTEPPSKSIRDTLAKVPFESRHLDQWSVWAGESEHGTALLVSGLSYDLRVQIDDRVAGPAALKAKRRWFETLSSFVDPFTDAARPEVNAAKPEFTYAVQVWRGARSDLIIGTEKQFNRHMVEPLEHHIEGQIGADGVFRGRVKAFGEWLPGVCEIAPPTDLAIGARADTLVGPVDLFIATMEFASANTTHTTAEFSFFQDLAEKYSGFLMFRDGLRVMPYGRFDNDFFEIDERRSRSAGREFWNQRQMFGRLAISRGRNPNLKDKAGREGLVDNRAAKTLKEIVAYILMQSARRYFGSASQMRKELLPEIRDVNAREKAAAAREKLKLRQRTEFRTKLLKHVKEAPVLAGDVHRFVVGLKLDREQSVINAQTALERFQDRYLSLAVGDPPKSLGSLEETFGRYRDEMGAVQAGLQEISDKVRDHIESVAFGEPEEVLKQQIQRSGLFVNARIDGWHDEIKTLQRIEYDRIAEVIASRRTGLGEIAETILHRLKTGDLALPTASKMVEALRTRLDRENSEILMPYIGALESLRDSIDLQNLATAGIEELSELRVELDRLNSLAQLGIAVEIVGHELQSFDDIIASGLRGLPAEVRESRAAKDIEFGYEGLTDQLKFLSPLRIAGQRLDRWITGAEIATYVREFFALPLARNKIELTASEDFLRFRVFDQQSRLYPVFINLVNNSLYWVATNASAKTEREIHLGIIDHRVVIADSGPGVPVDDVTQLFSLFFTKRARGGRGVGLYLSRANLAASGHRISYADTNEFRLLPGANFVIEFRGGEFE
ncbi:ATP-binding protein [Brevundimonas sp.]|uniref:ATP-binding protein n=1 Tax=Brevundimonas sp. TaxID=1871086 RepID=UPI0028A6F7A9|nr:ATP-binding protein [Brevundimonas sp.]